MPTSRSNSHFSFLNCFHPSESFCCSSSFPHPITSYVHLHLTLIDATWFEWHQGWSLLTFHVCHLRKQIMVTSYKTEYFFQESTLSLKLAVWIHIWLIRENLCQTRGVKMSHISNMMDQLQLMYWFTLLLLWVEAKIEKNKDSVL